MTKLQTLERWELFETQCINVIRAHFIQVASGRYRDAIRYRMLCMQQATLHIGLSLMHGYTHMGLRYFIIKFTL